MRRIISINKDPLSMGNKTEILYYLVLLDFTFAVAHGNIIPSR
jgi:hypothetical protein